MKRNFITIEFGTYQTKRYRTLNCYPNYIHIVLSTSSQGGTDLLSKGPSEPGWVKRGKERTLRILMTSWMTLIL